jgi:hypothetical protein
MIKNGLIALQVLAYFVNAAATQVTCEVTLE